MKTNHQKLKWALVVLLANATLAGAESVLNSVHNLSVSGPGNIKASREADSCVFCHSPHGSTPQTPLWNHKVSGATYTPYTSSTTKAVIGQPTGASKLCLSCHDGTVALGMVGTTNRMVMKNDVTTLPKGPANLGTDLSGDHPISFVYDAHLAAADTQLQSPTTLTGKVKLDENKQMQCTSCHDPHDNQFGNFLVEANDGSALCITCHKMISWTGSVHDTSGARWNGQGKNPWPNTTLKTVAANACENCHTSHNAAAKARLLTFSGGDTGCYVCHSGTVAPQNLRAEFSKLSVHPVDLTGSVHDAAEDPINSPRHVTCVDCHNPHAVKQSTPAAIGRTKLISAPMIASELVGVKGVNASGAVMVSATQEYQLCFRCHADSRNRGPASVPRQFPQTNKRLQFAPANASFHPVETAGKNALVPSLISPYTVSSIIACTDCHNNDQGPAAGGSGPAGPHGSAYAPLLERQQVLTDNSPESSASYALCYKCHSRTSILGNQSFPGHFSHVVNYKTACTTCHDSHGVAGTPNLINFNTTYVTPGPTGVTSYVRTGPNGGNCTLTCHGSSHNNMNYNNAALLRKHAMVRLPRN